MAALFDLDGLPPAPRHCFYDSDEEKDEEIDSSEEENLFVWRQNVSELQNIKTLLVCTTDVSAAFVKSYTNVCTDPVATLACTRPRNVLKGHYFSGREEEVDVTDINAIQNGGCVATVTHGVNYDFCNLWSEKVCY